MPKHTLQLFVWSCIPSKGFLTELKQLTFLIAKLKQKNKTLPLLSGWLSCSKENEPFSGALLCLNLPVYASLEGLQTL